MKRAKPSGYMKRSECKKTTFSTSVTIDAERLGRLLGFDVEKDNPVLDLVGFGKNIKISLAKAKRKDFRMTISWERQIKKKEE
jgi:hypothetical protein